jgi:HlyD family secretion protein
MKRLVIPIVVVALAVAGFLFRDRVLPQPQGSRNYLGYVEGETILIAAPQAGRLADVTVAKGAGVAKGDPLFALDTQPAFAEVRRAEAAIITAGAAYDNLLTGKRAEELSVIRAQIDQAQAALDLAAKEFTRADMLASTGAAAQSRRDAAVEQMKAFQGRIAELKANEAVARLPAREAERAAARSRIEEAKASADLARRKLAELSPTSPRDAVVDDVFFDQGEWVAAGQPVMALLSHDNITLRFFVPEAALAKATPGTRVTFRCDGCGAPRTATITHASNAPEFTPPVIYSETARAKLVYRIEAKPDAADPMLRPGLPVDVEPLR